MMGRCDECRGRAVLHTINVPLRLFPFKEERRLCKKHKNTESFMY